jgi:hypothetical protein
MKSQAEVETLMRNLESLIKTGRFPTSPMTCMGIAMTLRWVIGEAPPEMDQFVREWNQMANAENN